VCNATFTEQKCSTDYDTSNVYTWPILYKEINVFKLMQMYHKYIHER